MSINIKSINHYQIKLDNNEKMARLCLEGKCGHGTEDRCARNIATEGWHESVEENRLMTVQEYMMMAPSEAEEFVKRWGGDGVDELRAKVAALKSSDPMGILTMFAFIVGDPADDTLRADFYEFLEDDDAGPEVTESNFYWEMEKSMKAFADLKRAEKAWASRTTANAGPNCDQCGNARTGIGGRVCELCDLARQDSAIVHNHVICHCCVDDQEDEDYDYDDGSQPPRAKDIPRRGYDDGFDDEYDGPDEDEEERRQEMAEENERQMEAEDELNRAVFEHNSTPTGDPHIRVSHLSPVVPDNWQEIVNR